MFMQPRHTHIICCYCYCYVLVIFFFIFAPRQQFFMYNNTTNKNLPQKLKSLNWNENTPDIRRDAVIKLNINIFFNSSIFFHKKNSLCEFRMIEVARKIIIIIIKNGCYFKYLMRSSLRRIFWNCLVFVAPLVYLSVSSRLMSWLYL